MQWYDDVQRRIAEYDIPRSELSQLCGVRRETLSRILNGKQACAQHLRQRIQSEVEKYNPAYTMDVLFDYVRVRFPTLDYEKIMREVLQIEPAYFQKEDHAFYGYRTRFTFQEIVVMIGTEEDMGKGTLVELKGTGCRSLEYLFDAQSRTWSAFFAACLDRDGVFKRIDLAINDKAGILDIPAMLEKMARGEYISIFRSYKPVAQVKDVYVEDERYLENPADFEGDIYRHERISGTTLYIGSQKSEIYFCVYQKDVEQFLKLGIPLEDAEVKNRFEVRLSNERAQNAITDMFDRGDGRAALCDFGQYAMDIVNQYFTLLEPDKTKDKEEWSMDFRWKWFIGEGRQNVSLTTKPEPYTLERSLRWMLRQVAPTLAMLLRLDELQGTHFVEDMLQAQLPPKQLRYLKQFLPDITAAVHLLEPPGGRIEIKDIALPAIEPLTRAQLDESLKEKKAQAKAAQLQAEVEDMQVLLNEYKEGCTLSEAMRMQAEIDRLQDVIRAYKEGHTAIQETFE